MQGWRVSKYNPANRDATGRYIQDDWTSVHDIGRVIAERVISLETYLRAEQAYVDSAVAFYGDAGAPPLVVRAPEFAGPPTSLLVPGEVLVSVPEEGAHIGLSELPVIVRSCLRELMWCRLEAEDFSCMVHFGYDYYMYLTGAEPSRATLELMSGGGLFCEPCQSPYLSMG